MVYNYELAVIRHFHKFDNNLKQAIYATDEDLLESLDKVKGYPSLYYSRKEMRIMYNKPISFEPTTTDPIAIPMYPYQQTYVATILVEGQREAFAFATNIKYYLAQNPYVWVTIPHVSDIDGGEIKVRVNLMLTDVLVEEVRRPNDPKGSCRIVRIQWFSNLVTVPSAPESHTGFVNQVNIYNDPDYNPERPDDSMIDEKLLLKIE